VNAKLKAAREASGKTQAQVAKEVGVSEPMYQRYEYGQNEPGVKTAIRIADALGVENLRELFGTDDDVVQRRLGTSDSPTK
jgi:XRE family transcriptional regulator